MYRAETRPTRRLVAGFGVVLHRARSKWIRTEIHRVLPVGQTSEVSDKITFADFDEHDRLRGEMIARNEFFGAPCRQVRRTQGIGASTRGREFEQRRLFGATDQGRARALAAGRGTARAHVR